jgi:hypothetical protein
VVNRHAHSVTLFCCLQTGYLERLHCGFVDLTGRSVRLNDRAR